MSKKRYVKGAKAAEPQTVEEYLEAGVELEEAGEKWRAGDTAKAFRFFSKALQSYENGLRIFPKSFDLAYNQARLQYDISQQPKLVQQQAEPLPSILQTARISHLRALELDESNTDVLFNLAQVNRSIAELINETNQSVDQRQVAADLLHQAVDLFVRCLQVQEQILEESRHLSVQSSPSMSGTETRENNEAPGITEETWASVIEPTTEDTLLDTCLAELECLRSICDVQTFDITNSFSDVEAAWLSLKDKIYLYAVSEERAREVMLSQIAFISSFACARFQSRLIDLSEFDTEFSTAMTPLEAVLATQQDSQALCLAGETDMKANAAFRYHFLVTNDTAGENLDVINRLSWAHATKALEHLNAASKMPDIQDLARVHIERGDCEMVRACLGDEPFNYKLAMTSRPTLLKNAGVFYSAAKKTVANRPRAPDTAEDRAEVDFKIALVAALLEDNSAALAMVVPANSSTVTQQLIDARDDGLISRKVFDQLAGTVSASKSNGG